MKILLLSIQDKRDKFEIIPKNHHQILQPFCFEENQIIYTKFVHLDMEEAQDNARFLSNEDVKLYLIDALEIDEDFIASLLTLNLISEEEKNMIMTQQGPADKVIKCLDLIWRRHAPNTFSLFCKALNEKNDLHYISKDLKDILHAHTVQLGNTLPIDHTVVKIYTPNSDAAHQMTQYNINAIKRTIINSRITVTEDSTPSVYNTQRGCIEIFFHSTTGPIYDTIANQSFLKNMTEQFFKQSNVQASLSQGQIVTIVVKRDPFSLPLKDESGNAIQEFSKQQTLRINYTFIKWNIKNLDKIVPLIRKYRQHATLDIQSYILESAKSCDDLEELLQLMQTCENGAWSMFIKLLRDFDNVKVADQLEKMSCIECYRRSVIVDLQNVMRQIDTSLMEKTFEGKSYIPDVVKEDCILSKGKRPRIERAKCFLDYVLIKGDILIRFAEVFASLTNTIITFSPCKKHDKETKKDGKDNDPANELKFTMKVCIDENGEFYLENVDISDKHVDERLERNSVRKNDEITNTLHEDETDKLALSQTKKPKLNKEHEDLDVPKAPLCPQIKATA